MEMDESEKFERILSRIEAASKLDSKFLSDVESVHRELGTLTADDMYRQFSI
jgi:hypothetical protein